MTTNPQDPQYVVKCRSNASQMAKTILARKYRDEYRELYAKILKEEFGVDYTRHQRYQKYMEEEPKDAK